MSSREELLARLDEREPWDFLVIGGGATGLGTAVEAASRGPEWAAPAVARLMAAELGRDAEWERRQVAAYRELARGYRLD